MTILTNDTGSAAAAPTARKFAILLVRARRRVNNWMAALIARYERQAATEALHKLIDIGIFRSQIDEVLANSAKRTHRGRR